MNKIIYYFSGTGNSLRTARIIAKEIGGAKLISMSNVPSSVPANDAKIIGFVCPVYEWDIPEPVKFFVKNLTLNPQAYIFMVSTYIAIHGRCFETMDSILVEKGAKLHYGRALRCVASQCIAYEPFPNTQFMVPYSEKIARKIGGEIACRKNRNPPKMSRITKSLYTKMMVPFLEVQHEYDKGFYTTENCIGCEICRKVCPCMNISFENGHPNWNHNCVGCNACVVFCPKKAILFNTPEAYVKLDNVITRRLGLPEKRTRYHNPHISANDMMKKMEDFPFSP